MKGIEPMGNLVDAPTKFNIETVMAGNGEVDVIVINPRGQKEPVNTFDFVHFLMKTFFFYLIQINTKILSN